MMFVFLFATPPFQGGEGGGLDLRLRLETPPSSPINRSPCKGEEGKCII